MVSVAVKAVLLDDAGNFCLLRRSTDPFSGRWDLPGGTVESGESPALALRREIREETGTEIVDIHYLGCHWLDVDGASGRQLSVVYTGRASGPPVNREPLEHGHLAMVQARDASSLPLSPSAEYALGHPGGLAPFSGAAGAPALDEVSVLLLQPFFPLADAEALSIPLGLAYLHARLRADGVPVAVLDCSLGADYDTLLNLPHLAPPIVGVQFHSAMSWDFCLMACRELRSTSPGSTIVAGGEVATQRASRLLLDGLVDFVVDQEGEETFGSLVRRVRAGESERWTEVPGLHGRDEDGVVTRTTGVEPVPVLDDLPRPSISAFRWEHYGQWSMMTSRGCPFRCTYCSSAAYWNHSIRYHSAQWILDEMRRLSRFGARDVYIADDTFTLNRRRVDELCDELERRPLLRWSCLTRVDCVDEEMLARMAAAGCTQISFGFETANDSTLRLVSKKTRFDQAVRIVTACRDVGIRSRVSVIFGLPGESAGDLARTTAAMTRLRPNEVQLYGLTPHDGTALYGNLERLGVRILETDPARWTRSVLEPVCETDLLSAAEIAEAGRRCIDSLAEIGYVDLTDVGPNRKIGAEYTVGTAFTPIQGIGGVVGRRN